MVCGAIFMSKDFFGVGFLGCLFLLFLGLKLGGVISWSWLWVFSPLLIPLALALLVLLIVFIVSSDYIKKKRWF
jgi:energy-coupling factor transporter transmembrane protein EcfT